MFKASGIVVTPEEVKSVNESEFPLEVIRLLIEKYHVPTDVGFSETGEFYFDV